SSEQPGPPRLANSSPAGTRSGRSVLDPTPIPDRPQPQIIGDRRASPSPPLTACLPSGIVWVATFVDGRSGRLCSRPAHHPVAAPTASAATAANAVATTHLSASAWGIQEKDT